MNMHIVASNERPGDLYVKFTADSMSHKIATIKEIRSQMGCAFLPAMDAVENGFWIAIKHTSKINFNRLLMVATIGDPDPKSEVVYTPDDHTPTFF